MKARWRRSGAAAALAVFVLGACGDDDQAAEAPADSGPMVLATTTSTQDSGLLDDLLPRFENASGCSVKTVAVGSSEAIELGAKGDADALVVHSPGDEEEFMAAGHGVSRKAVMHNDFVLVGPPEDPAQVTQAAGASEALIRIAEAQVPFTSRGDDSGTHTKELALWEAAGTDPSGEWYLETGQGMGETLTIADQKQAYTISDRGTFLATDNLESKLLVEGGKELLNRYHVIVVRGKEVNAACARKFSSWITEPATQRQIKRFGVAEYGEPLFFPDAEG